MINILRFILGRSGSGKTYEIRKMIEEKVGEGQSKIILIVPEQNTFENEKEMLKILGEKGSRRVEVLSFTRIADYVFRKCGKPRGKRLSDGGRSMFMSMALDKAGVNLKLYAGSSDRMDIVNLMTDSLREFKMCGVDKDTLSNVEESLEEGTLRNKIKETSSVLEIYEDLISNSFADPLDDLSITAEILSKNDIFRDYYVFVDAFSGFTIQQYEVLRLIMCQSKDTYVSFCTGSKIGTENSMGLFSSVDKQVKFMSDLALRNGINVGETIILDSQPRYKSEEIKIAERNIFKIPKEICDKKPSDIVMYNASDLYDECNYIARTIRKMVIEDKYRYRDFAVIARDINTYSETIKNVFSKYDILYFLDNPETVVNKALMSLVFSAFDAVKFGYEPEDIFRYLKTGLAGLTTDEISIIENYVLLWDIKSKRWTEEFTMSPSGFSGMKSTKDEQELIFINELRKRIITPLEKFKAAIHNTTGDKIARALYNLLEEIDVPNSIQRLCKSLYDSNNMADSQELSRLWDILMEALDQTYIVLEGVKISAGKYAELLSTAVQSADIAFIPQGLDEVTVGQADRVRLSEPKVVFVIGAVDGEFPRIPVQSGIFNDLERRKLISMGLNMYDTLEGLSMRERFLAYNAISSGSEKLYISWASASASGAGRHPSEIVREIKRIFPNILVYDGYGVSPYDMMWSEKSAFEICAENWKSDVNIFMNIKKYFLEKPEYQRKAEAIDRAVNKKLMNFDNPDKALELFGKDLSFSVSQIEKFYSCRFQYFCIYGLRAKERKPAEFNVIEYGSLMHFLFEKIMLKYPSDELCNLDSEELESEVRKLMNQYVEDKLGGWQTKTPRFRYLYMRCLKTAVFLLKRLSAEFSQSEFKPVDFELKISKNGDIPPLILKLPDGGTAQVEGKIDRVDIMKKDGKSYIRVVDYKTGVKEFKLSDVLYGLNMQMLVYMSAVCKSGKERYGEVVPAGALYMPAIKPSVSVSGVESPESIQTKVDKKLRMNGIILNDESVVKGMEQDVKGIFIPILSLKEGGFRKTDTLAGLEEIGIIIRYVDDMIRKMSMNLKKGEVSAYPLANGRSCDWCAYGCVCGYGDDEPVRSMKNFDKDETVKKMLEKEKNPNG